MGSIELIYLPAWREIFQNAIRLMVNHGNMQTLKCYIKAFSALHTNVRKGHKAPHKAVLLLAIMELIEQGEITSPRIKLSDQLNEMFHTIWSKYIGTSAIFTPDIGKPFFHLQHETFWKLIDKTEAAAKIQMAAEPCPFESAIKKKQAFSGSYTLKSLRESFAYAEIDPLLFKLLQQADHRAVLRTLLIDRYLSNQPTAVMPDINCLLLALPFLAVVA